MMPAFLSGIMMLQSELVVPEETEDWAPISAIKHIQVYKGYTRVLQIKPDPCFFVQESGFARLQ